MIEQLMNDPESFLNDRPVIVAVPPDTIIAEDKGRFRIQESNDYRNGGNGGVPCLLERVANGGTMAYWCPYIENQASGLGLGNEADLLFTANMDGCSFLVRGGQQMINVSHSNAGDVGQRVFQNLQGKSSQLNWSRALQKSVQLVRGRKKIGQETGVIHSRAQNCTTVIGCRSDDHGWRIYAQVNSVAGAMAEIVQIVSVTRLPVAPQ